MAKLKKGARLTCVPCGRRVIVDCCGVSSSTIWCCGRPMKAGVRKAAKRKTRRAKK